MFMNEIELISLSYFKNYTLGNIYANYGLTNIILWGISFDKSVSIVYDNNSIIFSPVTTNVLMG